MTLLADYKTKIIPTLQKELNKKSVLALPRIEKIVVNVGLGRALKDEKLLGNIVKDLSLITGQKPVMTKAKRAIANFKTREGQVIGAKVTLRGQRMYDFLERLLKIALPRTRDFRGISKKSFDKAGSLTLGIKEHTIFPEISGEDIRNTFGFEITVVAKAKNSDEVLKLYQALGFPIK